MSRPAGIATRGYAAKSATTPLEPFDFERRAPGPHDVVIEIMFCGICHSDIHQARNEWGGSRFPMVPGHEIVGRVTHIGADVTRYAPGDMAGVGCFVDSCRRCSSCRAGLEQYCEDFVAYTYNSTEMDRKTPTYGGYSARIVVDENYVVRIPEGLDPAAAAPLLCAGITTYSPLKHFGVGPGSRVAIVGLGGLGHMGVKLAAALGAEVTVLSTSPAKADDARRLGAHHFVVSTGDGLKDLKGHFDFILDTASAPHDLNAYLNLLRLDGAMVLVGIPSEPSEVHAFSVISNRRRLAGSSIGGIAETQEMLDFCAERSIASDIEIVPVQSIATAYERTIRGDVRYRFVIDMSTL